MIPAAQALDRLKEGNRRYVSGTGQDAALACAARRSELVTGQSPFAIVLGCSDSRVPAEIVFDQGLGSLFVIRIAGNIVAPSQIGSVEFAAEQFETGLVVVLGHSQCGAVLATLQALQQPASPMSRNIQSIVERIRPAVEPLLRDSGEPKDSLMDRAIRANVRMSCRQLRHGSEILERRIRDGRLRVVGAEYSLCSGVVDFFELGEEANDA